MYAAVAYVVFVLLGFLNIPRAFQIIQLFIEYALLIGLVWGLSQHSSKMRNVVYFLLIIIPINLGYELLARHWETILDMIPFVIVFAVTLSEGIGYIVFGNTLREHDKSFLSILFIIKGIVHATFLLALVLPIVNILIGIFAVRFFKRNEAPNRSKLRDI